MKTNSTKHHNFVASIDLKHLGSTFNRTILPGKSPAFVPMVLTLLLLILQPHSIFGQVVLPGCARANFGVDADVYANYSQFGGLPGPVGLDDWFVNSSLYPGAGIGVIDTTGTLALKAHTADPVQNKTFLQGMAFPYFHNTGDNIFIDAVFFRDYFGGTNVATNHLDSTSFVQASKNGENPLDWKPGLSNVQGKNDIIDIYAHARRDGTSMSDDLWLFAGVSVIEPTGSMFRDFELFQEAVTYDPATASFTSGGPDLGHTAFQFDAAGNITRVGDLIVMISADGAGVGSIDLRIWVSKSDYENLDPVNFDFDTGNGTFDGALQNSAYGYAILLPETGNSFEACGLINLNSTTMAPPWGTKGTGSMLETAYNNIQFTEFGLNLTSLGIDAQYITGNPCDPSFGSLMVKTRATSSFTAALKDFAGPVSFGGPPPIVFNAISDDSGIISCANQESELTVMPDIANHYVWKTTDGNIVSAADSSYISVDAPGIYIVGAYNFGGCDTIWDTVIVALDTVSPGAFVTGGTLSLEHPQLSLGGSPSGFAYNWEGPGGYTSSEQHPVISDPGTYILTVTNMINGCYDTDTVIVLMANPPDAVDDINQTLLGQAVDGQLLTNDSDYDGDLLLVTTTPIGHPSNGTVVINADGSYTYTPDPGFTGTDEFVYEVCDDASPPAGPLCDTAIVSIHVTQPGLSNDPPVGTHDHNQTLVNMPITGSQLLSNDSDPDGDPLMINTTPVSTTNNGSLVIHDDGTYTYTPNPDFTGEDSFTYEVCDSGTPALCDTVLVTLTVYPTDGSNSGFASDDAMTTPVNTTTGGDLLANDFDPEGDSLTINTTPLTTPTNGTLMIYPDGTYSYTPDTDFTGNDQFTYEVCDNGLPQACDTATVYLTVFPDNNPPMGITDINNTLINMPVDGQLLTNDIEPDGDSLTINTVPITPTTNGTLVIYPDGGYSYVPDTDFVGTDTFTYEICDDVPPELGPLCDTAMVVLTVSNVTGAMPPVANPDENLTFTNTPVNGTMTNNDGDPNQDRITLDTIPVSGPANGTVTLNADGSYTYIPDPDFVGVDSFEYRVCDVNLPPLCDTTTVSIHVIPDNSIHNDPPFAGDDASFTPQDVAVGGNLLPNDHDPNGNSILMNTTPVSGPSNGTVMINPDGTYVYTPNPGYTGPDYFIYEVCDDQVPTLCAQATVYITVYPGSLFPVEWLDFTARRVGQDGLLEWATASELNASHFVVQRSLDGHLFQNIGTVSASGTTNEVRHYNFVDFNVLDIPGDVYSYRLKQVDLNGSFSFSRVVEIRIIEDISVRVNAYPNPVIEVLNLEVFDHAGADIEAALYNLQGAQVRTAVPSRHDPDHEQMNMEVSDLPSGYYIYRVFVDEQMFSGKVMKE